MRIANANANALDGLVGAAATLNAATHDRARARDQRGAALHCRVQSARDVGTLRARVPRVVPIRRRSRMPSPLRLPLRRAAPKAPAAEPAPAPTSAPAPAPDAVERSAAASNQPQPKASDDDLRRFLDDRR